MKHLALLLLLVLPNFCKAQSPEIAVEWHTMRVTSDYAKSLKEHDLVFVWVGHKDLQLFEKLIGQHQCYVETLPGIKSGLLIGRGKLVEGEFDAYMLSDPKVKQQILEKYSSAISSEEKLARITPPIYETRVITQPQVIRNYEPDAMRPGMHKHKCGDCGYVWAHYPGGSHTCPNCHTGEWTRQYTGPEGALTVH